jgi:hypothetical protein
LEEAWSGENQQLIGGRPRGSSQTQLQIPQFLQLAAGDKRVLVSRDAKTMPHHFAAFVVGRSSPGVILIPASVTIGGAIEELLMIWRSWSAEDIKNQIWWLPG